MVSSQRDLFHSTSPTLTRHSPTGTKKLRLSAPTLASSDFHVLCRACLPVRFLKQFCTLQGTQGRNCLSEASQAFPLPWAVGCPSPTWVLENLPLFWHLTIKS